MKNHHIYSEKLASVLNNLFHGILLVNEKGIILEFNEASLNILGKTTETLSNSSLQTLLPLLYKESFTEYFNTCLNVDDCTYRKFETDYFNGETKLVLEIDCNQNFLSEEDGEMYTICVLNNITRQARLEKELVKQKKSKQVLLEKLEHEQEFSDLKSRFITIASHEFRTPLAGILSSIDLIERYLTKDSERWEGYKHSDKLKSHMHKIKKSVESLTNNLSQFLSMELLKDGDVEYIEEEFNLEDTLEVLVDEFQILEKNQQEIHFEFLSDEKDVVLDKSILKNVIICLLSNAVKYTPEGKNIYVSASIDNSLIEIIIKDEGIGIPKAGQRNMFRRFFKAKNATNLQGIGLGLNIALRYVHLMNGDITFDSEENKGTTFKISFEREVKVKQELNFNEKGIVDRG